MARRRGILNPPNLKIMVFFGFLLIPVFFLCYTGRLGYSLSVQPLILLAILVAMLAASMVEIPLYSMRSRKPDYNAGEVSILGEIHDVPLLEELRTGDGMAYKSTVTLNLGGFILPLILALYVATISGITEILTSLLIMVTLTYFLSEIRGGIGIIIPDYMGLLAVPISLIISPSSPAPIILVSGVIGILLAMIIILLSNGKEQGSAFFNLGGTGSFKAMYITVLLAVIMSFQ